MNHRSVVESSNGIETGELMLPWEKSGGYLFTGQVVPGIEVARA